jgi:hypothetical protein
MLRCIQRVYRDFAEELGSWSSVELYSRTEATPIDQGIIDLLDQRPVHHLLANEPDETELLRVLNNRNCSAAARRGVTEGRWLLQGYVCSAGGWIRSRLDEAARSRAAYLEVRESASGEKSWLVGKLSASWEAQCSVSKIGGDPGCCQIIRILRILNNST